MLSCARTVRGRAKEGFEGRKEGFEGRKEGFEGRKERFEGTKEGMNERRNERKEE